MTTSRATWRRRAMAVVAVAVVAATSCGGTTSEPQRADRPGAAATTTAAPVTVAATASGNVRVAALTPLDPGRVPAVEQLAIVELGRSPAGTPHTGHAHGHGGGGTHLELPLFNGDAATFAEQWLTALRSVNRFDSTAKAAALGYVRASAPGGGIGTHWVKWSQVAKPFDPANPAMLLFDERKQPAALVGYSYWVQSSSEPTGFAGDNDQWHQHTGLCVVNGWVDREEASGPDQCAGTYLAGGDLWMLHAWVVPAFPNRFGRFATFNPTLCPPAAGTPDISRCPG